MNWGAAGALSEIVGTAAVLITLHFLAVQGKQVKKYVHSESDKFILSWKENHMTEDLHSDFGPEISLEEAMGKLAAWSAAGAEHAFSYTGKDEGIMHVISRIVKVHENMIICTGNSSQLFFRFEEAKFVFGPMALMEYPVRQKSVIDGLHVFLKTGSYLFISGQAQLPALKTSWLETD